MKSCVKSSGGVSQDTLKTFGKIAAERGKEKPKREYAETREIAMDNIECPGGASMPVLMVKLYAAGVVVLLMAIKLGAEIGNSATRRNQRQIYTCGHVCRNTHGEKRERAYGRFFRRFPVVIGSRI